MDVCMYVCIHSCNSVVLVTMIYGVVVKDVY